MVAHPVLGVQVGSVGGEQAGDGGGLGLVQRGGAQWTPARHEVALGEPSSGKIVLTNS